MNKITTTYQTRTVTPKLSITAEGCRQNALACAGSLQDTKGPYDGDQIAALATMWATIGQLCCALGDPDNPEPRTHVNYNVTDNNPDRCTHHHPNSGGRCKLPADHGGACDIGPGFTRKGLQ